MRKFASLQHDLAAAFFMDVIGKPSYYTKNTSKIPPKKPSIKKLRKLEMVFSEFYLSLVLLQNYQTLNYSGFRKILKKHDKVKVEQLKKKTLHTEIHDAVFVNSYSL